jgi:hypothetical protein
MQSTRVRSSSIDRVSSRCVCEDVVLGRELLVASKDKGGAKNKKVASKSLKEKREAKKAKGASSSGASGASR